MSELSCWLCGEIAPLKNSHIIPKFVFRWLIETGGTPYLRMGANPNVRKQDGDTHRLYCGSCEQRLSEWENLARNRIFIRATEKEDISGRYGPWLSRFAASLALRVIQSQKYRGIFDKYEDFQIKALNDAENRWRQFLTGAATNPAQNSLHLIYLGYFDSFDAENLPSNWNTWVHRSVERDTLLTDSGSFLVSYVKLGPLIFVGKILDESNKLGNDFLKCNQGLLEKRAFSNPKGLWKCLLDRGENAQRIMKTISDKQAKKIEKEVFDNPERFLDSQLAELMMRDFEQFGQRD